MKKTILLLLLVLPIVTLPAHAGGPVIREAFPSDYKATPCAADTDSVCKSFNKEKMTEFGGTFRGFDIRPSWVNEHWDEMRKVISPSCAKIASCFTIKDNDWVYCVDLVRDEILGTCVRFPEGTEDRRQCSMFTMTYYIGLGSKASQHKAAQECTDAAPAADRTLTTWIEPQTFGHDFNGKLVVHAYDSETHIPVRAKWDIDSGTLTSTEGPVSTAGYISLWKAGLKRVPNAQGHFDVVSPTVTMTATGYKPVTFPIALDVPRLTVEMTPPVSKLKHGMNTITITARDAATGKPAAMRVMAGDRVIGRANAPFQFEWPRGKKRPEIWLTSLFDLYSDVVVAKGQ
jgi:hypothetical protein